VCARICVCECECECVRDSHLLEVGDVPLVDELGVLALPRLERELDPDRDHDRVDRHLYASSCSSVGSVAVRLDNAGGR